MISTADIFTIVYGSSYLIIVLYLSIYCWIKLEDELIFIIQKITIEYKKIASATVLHDSPINGNISPSGSPRYPNIQFSGSHTSVISQHLQKHLNNTSGDYGSLSFGAGSVVHGSFLRPIPDSYYEKFIKPFDIYLQDDENNENKQDENKQLAIDTGQQDMDTLSLSEINSTRKRQRKETGNNQQKIGLAVKFFYWVWVTWNMSAIYGSLIIHIWDMATDIAVMIKWYSDGSTASPTKWLSSNGDIDLLALFILSILFVLLYRIIASLMIYSLTKSPLRVLSQLIFDLEIYRTIFISFKLKLSEPGYIQTWLQKLEATFESLPQAVLQISYLARIENWNEEEDSTVVITSILLSLVTMAERFERDDKLYFPYDMYYITKETFPYISFPYIIRFTWRLCEVTCRTFIFVLIWLTIGGYLLSFIFIFEALLIIYISSREGKYDFLSYFVAIPLGYLKQRRTWQLTYIRLIEHILMLGIIWLNIFINFQCEYIFGCFSNEKIINRLWLHSNNNNITFGFIILICATIMTILTPILYGIIWNFYIVKDISNLMATQERDIWVITKTGDIRGLTEMIEFGVNPDLRNYNNETLLHVYFCQYISYNQHFVDVLSMNNKFYMGAMSIPERKTILHAAVSHRMVDKKAIKFLLLQNEISINDIDSNGKTALMYYLCANKYNKNNKNIFLRDANINILKLMCDNIYKLKPELRDNNGNCIVHYAAMNPMMSDNNIEFIIDLYLNSIQKMFNDENKNENENENNNNNNNKNERRYTGSVQKKNNNNRFNYRPKGSEILTGKEHIEMYNNNNKNKNIFCNNNKWEYILDCIDVKNRFHETPFMFYLKNNLSISNSMINLFMENGMDPFIRDGFRNSVFHWAVKNSSINQQYGLDALKFMFQHIEEFGSLMDAFESNAKHETIFHTYLNENCGKFNKNIILLLLDYKIDINCVDLKGNTCLHYACKNIYIKNKFLIFLFTQNGGNTIMHINVKNLQNYTPIQIYKQYHTQIQFENLVNNIKNNQELNKKVDIDINNIKNPIKLKI